MGPVEEYLLRATDGVLTRFSAAAEVNALSSGTPLDDLLDSKTGRSLGDVVKDFKYQPNPNSCYPNGIHNLLKEISERHDVGLRFSERKVNRLTQYTEMLGPKTEVVVREMNKALKSHDYASSEGPNSTFGELQSVLEKSECSYPLVGLSPDYYQEVAPRYKIKGRALDHVVVVLALDEREAIVWDPYHYYLGPSARQEGKVGLVRIPTGRFLEFWESADEPAWMFWLSRRKDRGATLMEFEE